MLRRKRKQKHKTNPRKNSYLHSQEEWTGTIKHNGSACMSLIAAPPKSWNNLAIN